MASSFSKATQPIRIQDSTKMLPPFGEEGCLTTENAVFPFTTKQHVEAGHSANESQPMNMQDSSYKKTTCSWSMTQCWQSITCLLCLLTTWVSISVNNLSNLPNYNSAASPSLLNLNSSVLVSVTLWIDESSFITLGKTDKLRFGKFGKAAELKFSRFDVYQIVIHRINK